MPIVWSIGGNQAWLLFPRHLVPPCSQISHSLYLLPVNEHSLRAILATSPAHTACAPTAEAVLNVLRAPARQHALPPSVTTVIRTTPTATRFTLTTAQLTWLGCHGRTLIVVGALNAARIYTPTEMGGSETQCAACYPMIRPRIQNLLPAMNLFRIHIRPMSDFADMESQLPAEQRRRTKARKCSISLAPLRHQCMLQPS